MTFENAANHHMWILAIAVLAFLGACSDKDQSDSESKRTDIGASPSASRPSTNLAASAPEATGQHEPSELEKHEPIELAKSENFAARNGQTLVLHLESGKSIDLLNLDSCNSYENCLVYVYRGLIADKQFFLVNANLYEGGTTLLFSRKTGEKYAIIGEPNVSPNGKYIVAASDDEGGDPGVYLWEIGNGLLIQRFNFEPSEYQLYRFTRWVGSDKVEMIKTMWARDICPKSPVEFPVQLVAQKGAWKLEGAMEKEKITCDK